MALRGGRMPSNMLLSERKVSGTVGSGAVVGFFGAAEEAGVACGSQINVSGHITEYVKTERTNLPCVLQEQVQERTV